MMDIPEEAVKVACRRCYGTGKLYTPVKDKDDPTYICPECKGEKYVLVKRGEGG
jgi:Zn finger protein HypA/HybF involved in hydrogenase expression